MTTTAEFILDVQATGSEGIVKIKVAIENLNEAAEDSAKASEKMANGMDKVEKKTRFSQKATEGVTKSYQKMGSVYGLVAAAVTGAVAAYVAKIVDAAATLNGFSDDIGINAQKLQVYADVATLAGGSLEGVVQGIKSLNEATQEGLQGNEQIQSIFGKLNIDIAQFEKLKPDEKIAKLGQALKGYSIADQDYVIKKLKSESLAKLLKAPDEVAERQNYLEQNGLLVDKEQIEQLNKFSDMFANLMTDISNFSTNILGGMAVELGNIFDLNTDGKNTILNGEVAKMIADFAVRLITIFKILYESLQLAGAGLGALYDKGAYVVKKWGAIVELLVADFNRTVDIVKALFQEFSMTAVIDKLKANFDAFIANIQQKIGKIQIAFGKLLGVQSLVKAGTERLQKGIEDEAAANTKADGAKIMGNFKEKYDAANAKFEVEREALRKQVDDLNAEYEKKDIDNINNIKDKTAQIGKTFDKLLEVGQKRNKVEAESGEIVTKKLGDLGGEKKTLEAINKLELLRIQYLKQQGLDTEANEAERVLAIAQAKKDYTDLKQQGEAIDIINKMFNYNQFKIDYDKVTEDLEKLKEKSASYAVYSQEYADIQDQIKLKTEEQMALEDKLSIERKKQADEAFLNEQRMIAGNKFAQDTLTDGLKDYMKGAKTAGEVIEDMFMKVVDAIIDVIAQQIILNGLTAAFGKEDAASGKNGIASSIIKWGAAAYGGWGGAAGNVAASTFHNGGQIEQSNLIRPEGFNFARDEGLIVARANETVVKADGTAPGYQGGGENIINNNILISGETLSDKMWKTKSMESNMFTFMKKNGTMLKNYLK